MLASCVAVFYVVFHIVVLYAVLHALHRVICRASCSVSCYMPCFMFCIAVLCRFLCCVFQVNNWIQAIMIKLLPCFMLTVLTVLLIHAMHKAYRKRMLLKSQGRKAESDKHGEHNRTTGMLLAVVVLFTITELPQGILTLMNIFIDCFRFVVYNPLGDLLDAMALINNSVNFVLYCSMSKQFRDTFMAVFCSFCARHRPGWLKLKLITSSRDGTGNTTVTTLAANQPPANNLNHTQV